MVDNGLDWYNVHLHNWPSLRFEDPLPRFLDFMRQEAVENGRYIEVILPEGVTIT